MRDALIGAAILVGVYWSLMPLAIAHEVGSGEKLIPTIKELDLRKISSLSVMFAITGAFWGWIIGWLL